MSTGTPTPGALVASDLVNGLTPSHEHGRALRAPADALGVIRTAASADPRSVAELRARHVAGFTTLADRLCSVFLALATADVTAAVATLNELLAARPASPHLPQREPPVLLDDVPQPGQGGGLPCRRASPSA